MSDRSDEHPLPNPQLHPHEALATRAFLVLLDSNADVQLQDTVTGNTRRVDMSLDGQFAQTVVPPELFQYVKSRRLLLEFESSTLNLYRLIRMSQGLLNAAIRSRHQAGGKKLVQHPDSLPTLVSYVPRIEARLRPYLKPTTELGVFVLHVGLQKLFVIDSSSVPSDSPYVYLKLLHVLNPRDLPRSLDRFLTVIESSKKFGALSDGQLEEFTMTIMQQLRVPEPAIELVKRTAFVSSYDRGALDTSRSYIRTLAEHKHVVLSPQSIEKLDACQDIEMLKKWLLAIGSARPGSLEL